jgi:hypothetical protein
VVILRKAFPAESSKEDRALALLLPGIVGHSPGISNAGIFFPKRDRPCFLREPEEDSGNADPPMKALKKKSYQIVPGPPVFQNIKKRSAMIV